MKNKFADWVKERIEQCGFKENVDYVSFSEFSEKTKGGRPTIEYHLSLDACKHFAMMERNDRGYAVRQYFIDFEKQARNTPLPPPKHQPKPKIAPQYKEAQGVLQAMMAMGKILGTEEARPRRGNGSGQDQIGQCGFKGGVDIIQFAQIGESAPACQFRQASSWRSEVEFFPKLGKNGERLPDHRNHLIPDVTKPTSRPHRPFSPTSFTLSHDRNPPQPDRQPIPPLPGKSDPSSRPHRTRSRGGP